MERGWRGRRFSRDRACCGHRHGIANADTTATTADVIAVRVIVAGILSKRRRSPPLRSSRCTNNVLGYYTSNIVHCAVLLIRIIVRSHTLVHSRIPRACECLWHASLVGRGCCLERIVDITHRSHQRATAGRYCSEIHIAAGSSYNMGWGRGGVAATVGDNDC